MKELLSIFMAFQVLLSSLSFTIGLHFCGDQLRSFSFFEKAVPCEHGKMAEMHQSLPDCPFHAKQKQSKKKGCCNDKEVKIQGQDHTSTLSSFQVDFTPNFQFIAAYAVTLLEQFHSEDALSHKYLNYKPPLIRIDIPVLIQTFLI